MKLVSLVDYQINPADIHPELTQNTRENMTGSVRISKYLASWGADRPFAHMMDSTALANNIGETVGFSGTIKLDTFVQY